MMNNLTFLIPFWLAPLQTFIASLQICELLKINGTNIQRITILQCCANQTKLSYCQKAGKSQSCQNVRHGVPPRNPCHLMTQVHSLPKVFIPQLLYEINKRAIFMGAALFLNLHETTILLYKELKVWKLLHKSVIIDEYQRVVRIQPLIFSKRSIYRPRVIY